MDKDEEDRLKRIYAKLFPLNCDRDGISQPCKPCCVECGNYEKCLDKWREEQYCYCITDRKYTYCGTICKIMEYPQPTRRKGSCITKDGREVV